MAELLLSRSAQVLSRQPADNRARVHAIRVCTRGPANWRRAASLREPMAKMITDVLRKSTVRVLAAVSCAALLLFASAHSPAVVHAQSSAIVMENQQPGTPQSQWDIVGSGNLSLQGFATDISVNRGDTVHFKIRNTSGAT